MNKRFARRNIVVLLLVLLFAFGLRIFRLDDQSLWWDEGISLHLATSSLVEIWADRVQRLHPPGYFILLKGWLALVGISPFTARYLSALASLLQVTAVYAACRYWFAGLIHGRWAVWTATLLIVLSPLSIIYGQETRVYAFLPLVYLFMLMATTRLMDASSAHRLRWWIGLGLAEWIGVHLHYITFVLVAYVNMWLLWHIFRRQRAMFRQWIWVQAGVVLAGLPWFLAVLLNVVAVRNRMNTGRFLSEPVPLDFLVQQIWNFHFTGLAGSLARDDVRALALLAAGAFAGLVVWHLRQKASRPPFGRLLLAWGVPLLLSFLIWSVRSFAHPRYIAIFAVGIFPLVAYLVIFGFNLSGGRRLGHHLLALLLCASVLALSLLALDDYFLNPQVAKDDMRSVAQYLQAAAMADDLILVPDEDWSLPFEYHGDATIAMPGTKQRETMWAHLAQVTAVPRRVFVLDYERGVYDWQGVVPFVMERAGSLQEVVSIDALELQIFELDGPVMPLELNQVDARFESLHLIGAWIEAGVAADSAVTIALRWRMEAAEVEPMKVSLVLQDVDGWPLATKDQALVDENGRPPSFWPAGMTTTTYHVVPLPEGVPPLTYQMSISVFAEPAEGGVRPLNLTHVAGQRFVVGDTFLSHEVGLTANVTSLPDPFAQFEPVALVPGLLLRGAILDRNVVAPGQSLFVQLQWQATDALPAVWPVLRLVQGDERILELAESPVLDRYPMNVWQSGEIVTEHRRLRIPAQAEGVAEVVVGVGETAVSIGHIEIEPSDHLFVPPEIDQSLVVRFGDVARLVGYDLLQPVANPDEPLQLTLVWESLGTGVETNYKVFTHLVDENGSILAQHDAQPANGQRPTSGWVAGEYLTDPHRLTFQTADYSGTARIAVGLYDAESGVRLLTDNGDELFFLPETVTVTP